MGGAVYLLGSYGGQYPRPLLVDSSGRPIVSMLLDGGQYGPARATSIGDTVIAGRDGTATGRPVLVDTYGRPIVNMEYGVLTQPLPAGTNNIGDVDIASAPTLTVQPVYSAYWPAFSDRYADSETNDSISAGYGTLNLDAVPSGFFYKVSGASIRYVGTVATVVLAINAICGGNTFRLLTETTVVDGRYYPVLVDLLLKPGDYIQGVYANGTAGDDLTISAFGYIYPTA